MCDAHLGKVLDVMDELEMWDDTLLIVNTDHGFLLGEHDWWAKIRPALLPGSSACPALHLGPALTHALANAAAASSR